MFKDAHVSVRCCLFGYVLVVVFLPRWALILEDSSAFVCLQAPFPQLSAPFKASRLQVGYTKNAEDLTWKCFVRDRRGNWPRKFHPSSSWTNLCLVLLTFLLSSQLLGLKHFDVIYIKETFNLFIAFTKGRLNSL